VRGAYVVHQIEDGQAPHGEWEFNKELEALQRQREEKMEAEIAQKEADALQQARTELAKLENGLDLPTSSRLVQTDRQLMANNRFVHMPVVVVGRHVLKGIWGTIVGDYDSPERTKRLDTETRAEFRHYIEDDTGILATVKHDGSNKETQGVPIENLRHRRRVYLSILVSLPTAGYRSGLMASKARWLPREKRLGIDVGPLAPAHLARGGSPNRLSPERRTPSPPPDPGPGRMGRDAEDNIRLEREFDGGWLLTPGLAGKRVDVEIRGLCNVTRTNKLNVSATMLKDDEKSAILLREEPVTLSDLKKTITVFNIGGPQGRRGPMPAQCLRPRRELGGVSITDSAMRVIVLGPDVNNHLVHIGIYALTQPAVTHTFGPRVVAVKFVGRTDLAYFHRVYLCLSENREKDGFPATDFS
jgi:hypothetical protein